MKKAIEDFYEKHNYIFLGCVIAVLSCILYWNFIFGDKLFLYVDANDDTFQSFLPLYHLVVNKIKSHSFSFYSMNSGFGENLLSKQLCVFDPFALILYGIGIIFGIEKMAFAIVYVHIIKTICAGLACSFFLSYTDTPAKTRLLCSLLYAFSAYTVGDIGQHYFFATALVFVALGYAFVLRIIKKGEKYWILSIYVMVLCIWSVYFAYMILLSCALYFIYAALVEENSWNDKLQLLIRTMIAVVVGLLMSSAVLLPSAGLILTSTDRVNNGVPLKDKIVGSFVLFSKREYFVMILRSISNQLSGNINNWSEPRTSFNTEHYFLSVLFPAAIIEMFFIKIRKAEKKNIVISAIFAFGILICILTHFGGVMMNAFSDYSPRYLYVLMPFMAYILGQLFTRICNNELGTIDKNIIVITNSALVIIVLVFFNKNDKTALISAIGVCLALFLVTTFIIQVEEKSKLFICLVGITLLLHNLIDGRIAIETDRNIVGKGWYRDNGISRQIKQAVADAGASGDEFWRFERCFLDWGVQPATMYSDTANYRGVSFYDSIVTPRINTFRNQMLGLYRVQPTRATYAFGELGIPMDSDWASFYGIRYTISDYEVNDINWKLIGNYDEKHLYENTGLRYSGLLYNTYCTTDDVNNMGELERQTLLAETVVSNELSGDFVRKYDTDSFSNNIVYTDIEIISTGEVMNENIIDLSSFSGESRSKWMIIKVNAQSEGDYSVKFDTGFGFYDFYWVNSSGHYAVGDSELMIKVPTGALQAKVSFGDGVIITGTQIAVLQGKQYVNSGIELINDDMEGSIAGKVNCDENKILVLPIIADGNWTATVDGIVTEIKEVDYCFSGIELSKGVHEVLFQYRTPFFSTGVLLSAVGCVIFIGLIVLEKSNKEKMRGSIILQNR